MFATIFHFCFRLPEEIPSFHLDGTPEECYKMNWLKYCVGKVKNIQKRLNCLKGQKKLMTIFSVTKNTKRFTIKVRKSEERYTIYILDTHNRVSLFIQNYKR